MAQPMKMNQRLLETLSQTCRYYKARPKLLASSAVRNYHEAAASRSTSTGFSVTFADGPLENITAEPKKVASEISTNPKALTKRVSKFLNTRRTENAAAVRHGLEVNTDRNRSATTSADELNRKSRSLSAAKGKRGQDAAGSPATQEGGESASQEVFKEVPGPEEHVLQRDYPDTRTIEDAGRPSGARKGRETSKASTGSAARSPRPPSTYKEPWQVQKAALKKKFGEEGWNPRKKLSPDTMEGIRALHAQYPDRYTTPVLAEQFAVTPEAIRRILKSKWSSNLDPEKAAEKKERWARRHDRIWDVKSEIGLRPKRGGAKELEDPDQFEEELRGRQLLEAHRSA